MYNQTVILQVYCLHMPQKSGISFSAPLYLNKCLNLTWDIKAQRRFCPARLEGRYNSREAFPSDARSQPCVDTLATTASSSPSQPLVGFDTSPSDRAILYRSPQRPSYHFPTSIHLFPFLPLLFWSPSIQIRLLTTSVAPDSAVDLVN